MGEYALDANGHQIKLGTCEWLYYLRYDDRAKVTPCANSLDPRETAGTRLKFRLPWPDEDHIEIGAYEHHGRLEPLFRRGNDGCVQDWTDAELSEDTGALQVRHESGLLFNVACHHGLALPDIGSAPDISAVGWNGKRAAFGDSMTLLRTPTRRLRTPRPTTWPPDERIISRTKKKRRRRRVRHHDGGCHQ
jgi:hypothetical protein